MKMKDAPTINLKSPCRHARMTTISALVATLLSVVCIMIFCRNTVPSQTLRRQIRSERGIDQKAADPKGNTDKFVSSNSEKEESNASKQSAADGAATQPGGQALAGIKERGLPSLFGRRELSLWIPGFGNRAALLVIFRQLNLTPEQEIKIRDLRRKVGDRLRSSSQELNQLDAQLAEAIYGNLDPASLDSYDPEKVKELTEQVIQKRAEWFRLQTDIESQFRQILTPDQFYIYRELALQMMRPGSLPLINPAIRRQQQQRRSVQPIPQSKPTPQTKNY
ncbi:MAG: Spy/CpxP family protein refolding chaperone [Chloracidobacterium sp.]|nr:Spy/CpxP family protein refolding chaperone [Chloracidobacterium sp.]